MGHLLVLSDFIQLVDRAIQETQFVRLLLGNYIGAEADLKKYKVRPILIKGELKISITFQYKTKDITKNFSRIEFIYILQEKLNEKEFRSASLQTTEYLYTLQFNKQWKVTRQNAPHPLPELSHDKSKSRALESSRNFLQILGITSTKGEVYKHAQDKYKQINHYIELISPAVKSLNAKKLRVADMGSGKGYLTFALYDYLAKEQIEAEVVGVETRSELVRFCNQAAQECGFTGLSFQEGYIADYSTPENLDILIALHACDTATDDAIFKGIQAKANLIITAPCCHKQIRREMEKGTALSGLQPVLKHGILLERQAEMVTDAIRALLLEYAGYQTKIIQFISDRHTPKNVMIIAQKRRSIGDESVKQKLNELKSMYGIGVHYLEQLMGI